MARPNWEYVRIDVLMPTNPKVCGLGLASRWLLIELWCYCGQHLTDGFVPDAVWRRTGRIRDRQPLVDKGFAHRVRGGYQMHDYLEHQRSRAEVEEIREKRRKAGEKGGRAKASAKQVPEHVSSKSPSKTSSKHLAEAEAEAEADRSVADVSDQSSRRNARSDSGLIDLIISEIRHATGRTVAAGWAAGIRDSLLEGRDVTDPAAYLRQAIRSERDPQNRFLPVAANHPSSRTPAEAAFAAGLEPNGTPARGDTVASLAAQARQAIHREQP